MQDQSEIVNQLASVSSDLVMWLKASVPEAKNFVLEQAPLVAREIVYMSRGISTAAVGLGLGVLCVGLYIIRKSKRFFDTDAEDLVIPMWIIGGMIGLIGFAVAMANGPRFIKSWLAPRITIIDYVRNTGCR
jgi:hypothetical protein